METGQIKVVEKAKVSPPTQTLVEAIAEARAGKFISDRENDELTKALGNKEKSGRTRGKGPHYGWLDGFPEEQDTYRSRERAKRRRE